MANKQISQLTAKPTPVASTDQFGIDDNSSDSWKITVANLQTYFSGIYLLLSGGTLTGNLILNGDPTTNLMAATKQYVDALATGLNVQPSCRVGTTAALTVTYANGTAGVGATLTNAGAQAALVIDGVTLSVNDRVLVKNQASTLQNGIYTVTNVGSGATNWVMTRATDFDTPTEIVPGDFVLVLSGTTNAQTQWVQTATVTTVGTDAIVWDQFGADINALIVGIQNSSYIYSEDTGAADAYVATLAPAPTAYVEGMLVILDVANANTGASTINVNGLGLKNIVTEQNGTLQAGDLIAARRAWLLYDGTSFRLVNRNIEKRIQNESFNYILDTGAANAYVATLVPAVTAYVAGQRVVVKAVNANTGASTLNVNGLGVKDIKNMDGSALAANRILANMICHLVYDGTNFILLNPNLMTGELIGTQAFTANGTWTPATGCTKAVIVCTGGGGGGGGSGTGAGAASGTGGTSSVGAVAAAAGGTGGGWTGIGGAGGAGTTGTSLTNGGGGSGGGVPSGVQGSSGGKGGDGYFGGGGICGGAGGAGGNGANGGGGGGGGGLAGANYSGGGGGAGGTAIAYVTGVTGTYAVTIGAGGTAGGAGAAGFAGGTGGNGYVLIFEYA